MVTKTVRSETAALKENQQITISFFAENDRGCSHGDAIVNPDDENYALCMTRFGLAKPGDAKTIECEWKDGRWVDLN